MNFGMAKWGNDQYSHNPSQFDKLKTLCSGWERDLYDYQSA